ncbi:hypothetical protein QTI33_21585 [Variovorax sp. J22P271]|uniref:hypothetical protein n=1 Tax=Variovorax davisae TaxID=3053515 RepID=UPI0025782488|nr:hypothetical protein [Variovorax sp. J22P271]MDM0034741.1 hypothetical protein [Variovorax sp. J22P271]
MALPAGSAGLFAITALPSEALDVVADGSADENELTAVAGLGVPLPVVGVLTQMASPKGL